MAKLIMFRTVLPRTLIAFCLLGLVTARNPAVPPSTSIAPSTSSLFARNSRPPPPNIGRTRALDLAGLLHIEFNPIGCSLNGLVNSNVFVLASNRLEYDNGEIQQMDTYFSQVLGRAVAQNGATFYFDDPPPPPATLSETSGGLIGKSTDSPNGSCLGGLQITNIGKSGIQITGINMRLLSDAQLNQYQYRLIDICSFPSRRGGPCPGLGGGGAAYPYNFNLSMAKAGTVFSGQPQNGQPLLDPGQVAFVPLYFQSSKNLIYSVAPEITVSLVDEQRTFTLSQLTSTLAFANPEQFSCYQLQGNTNMFTQTDLSKGFCL